MFLRSISFLFLTLSVFCTNAFSQALRVGVIAPLSGPVADFGIAVRNGIELAKQNAKNPSAIEFIYEDSRYDSKASISAFNKLTETDKVDLIFSWGTNTSIVLSPIADQKKIPTVALSGDLNVAGDREYVIDFTNRLSEFSELTVEYLRKKGLKKFGIVKSEYQYTETLVEYFKSGLKPDESIVIIDSFSPDSSPNLNATVTKIKSLLSKNEIDSIGVFLGTGLLSTFYQKLGQFKVNAPTFGSDFMGQIDEMKKAGPPAVGAFYSSLNVTEDFTKKYVEKYKASIQLAYAANAHDFGKMLFNVFGSNTEKLDSAKILEKIEKAEPFDGGNGHVRFVKEDPKKVSKAGKRFISDVKILHVQEGGTSIVLDDSWKQK